MKAIWATKEGQDAAEDLRDTVKGKIAKEFEECMNSNLTELGYTSAAECLREEAEKAGLGDAVEELWF